MFDFSLSFACSSGEPEEEVDVHGDEVAVEEEQRLADHALLPTDKALIAAAARAELAGGAAERLI